MNTMPNIDMCQSLKTKAYQEPILSRPNQFSDPVNHALIHVISPAMMKNT